MPSLLGDRERFERGALIELWQANAAGRYRHDGDTHVAPLDPYFLGAGQVVTNEEGYYEFAGFTKGEGNRVIVVPEDHQPYLMRDFMVPDPPGLDQQLLAVGDELCATHRHDRPVAFHNVILHVLNQQG